MTSRRSKEVYWWGLFSAGGVLSALFIPVLVVLTGFGFILPAPSVFELCPFPKFLSPWPVRLVFFAVISLSLFHCAHRIRHTLIDLGLRPYSVLLGVVGYGGAAAGMIWAALILKGV